MLIKGIARQIKGIVRKIKEIVYPYFPKSEECTMKLEIRKKQRYGKIILWFIT